MHFKDHDYLKTILKQVKLGKNKKKRREYDVRKKDR